MIDNVADQIIQTYQAIQPYIKNTLLKKANGLSDQLGVNVYLKCENEQYTNAFKVRGAFSKMLSTDQEQLVRGVVTASSGNHGAAVAYAGQKLGIPVSVFLPENAAQIKINNIRQLGANIFFHGTDCAQAELVAQKFANEKNVTYISPYNDIAVVIGQGTIAHEIFSMKQDIDMIYVPVGGGGLISGIAAYTKNVVPNTMITGCMPENSAAMFEAIKAGHIIDIPILPTLSDATAGNIEPNTITFPMCQKYVDRYVLASEADIKIALQSLYYEEKLLAEGAAGVCLAVLQREALNFQNKNVVIVVSGGNVSEKVWECADENN